MRVSRSLLLGCLVSSGTTLVSFAAEARELAYQAPATCPSAEAVSARIEARAPRGRDARIAIQRTLTGFSGEVVLGAGDAKLTRTVDARSCGAVVEALTLVIALDREDEPPVTDDIAPDAAATTAAPTTLTSAAEPAEDTPPTSVAAKPRSATPLAVGLAWSQTSFARSSWLFAPSLFVGMSSTQGLGGVPFLQPSARVSLQRTLFPTRVSRGDERSADFLLTSGLVDVCPIGVGLERDLAFAACARLEVGSLRAGVVDDDTTRTSRLWGAAGGLGRMRYVMSSEGGPRVAFEMSAGLMAPLVRDRFHFSAGSPTVSAPPWAMVIAFGTSIEF